MKTIRDGKGIFGRGNIILEIDESGNLYVPDAFNMREYVGRIDDRGHIYKGIGIYEKYVGRVDSNGNLYDDTAFGGSYVGNVRDDGILRGQGMLGGSPTDEVGFGLSRVSNGSVREKKFERSGDEMPNAMAIVLGIVGLGIIYIVYKLFSFVAYYVNALIYLFSNTNMWILTLAIIIIPILAFLIIATICAKRKTHRDLTSETDSAQEKTTIAAKAGTFKALIVWDLIIVVIVVSIFAIVRYIPSAKDSESMARTEQEEFEIKDIATYRDYMQMIDGTFWYSDDMSISFNYKPAPENQGYIIDGEADVNGEKFNCFFLISSADADDELGIEYVLYEGDYNEDESIPLFYDGYEDVLTDYDEIKLYHEYKDKTEEIIWKFNKWFLGF